MIFSKLNFKLKKRKISKLLPSSIGDHVYEKQKEKPHEQIF
jgi:hypothetical protein